MKTCPLCREPLQPGTPIVEFVGGLFDPAEPEFFVMDEEILRVSHVHLDCLLKRLA